MKCENLVSKFACKSSATCLCRYGAESSAIFISFINIFSGLIFLTKKASPRFVDVLTWFNCLLIMGAIIVYSLFIVSEVWPYMFKTAKDVKERIRKQNKKEGEGEDDDAPAEAGVEAGAAGGEGGGTGAHPGLTNRAGGKKDDGKKQGWWSRSKPSTPKKKASVKKAGADRQDNEEEEEEEDVAGLFEAGNVERTDAMKRKDAQQGSVLAAVVGKNMLRITRIRNQVKAGLCKWNAVHLVDPQLESAWFQPLNLSSEKLVSHFAFKCNLYRRYSKEMGQGLFTRKAIAHLTNLPRNVNHSDPSAAAEEGSRPGTPMKGKAAPGSRPTSATGTPKGGGKGAAAKPTDVPTENVLKAKIPAPFSVSETLSVLEELKTTADAARVNMGLRTGSSSGRIKVRGLAALVSLQHISYVLENLLRIRVDKEEGPTEIYSRLRPHLITPGPKWLIGKMAAHFMRRFFGYDDIEFEQKGGLKVATKNVLSRMRAGKMAGNTGAAADVFKEVIPVAGLERGGARGAPASPASPNVVTPRARSFFSRPPPVVVDDDDAAPQVATATTASAGAGRGQSGDSSDDPVAFSDPTPPPATTTEQQQQQPAVVTEDEAAAQAGTKEDPTRLKTPPGAAVAHAARYSRWTGALSKINAVSGFFGAGKGKAAEAAAAAAAAEEGKEADQEVEVSDAGSDAESGGDEARGTYQPPPAP
jgi:hypothetical protein